ncbi:YgiT-type zinc finger protein [Tepidibacillus fermentans]|uniref:YgiT-type zinc finger domain-containing protein n=1 Tax=Tepidibacillus fermentans TaxID=1281767 RepID=A0A4R3KLS8_9BACI|nr:YgiT-type zinc finger protein [Tepidibacillus fermentans]TCS84550.1 YgiT-type zinc finger domain-containing protein [Tepidibacillus fermentans]
MHEYNLDCKGAFRMERITLERKVHYNDVQLKVDNFPIKKCNKCGEEVFGLTDLVMLDLFALESNAGEQIHVDFSVIKERFKDKDLMEEVLKYKN